MILDVRKGDYAAALEGHECNLNYVEKKTKCDSVYITFVDERKIEVKFLKLSEKYPLPPLK